MKHLINPNKIIQQMDAWEAGMLSDEETIELFQQLVTTGLAWQLQGIYGRTAQRLIDAGDVTAP